MVKQESDLIPLAIRSVYTVFSLRSLFIILNGENGGNVRFFATPAQMSTILFRPVYTLSGKHIDFCIVHEMKITFLG